MIFNTCKKLKSDGTIEKGRLKILGLVNINFIIFFEQTNPEQSFFYTLLPNGDVATLLLDVVSLHNTLLVRKKERIGENFKVQFL